MPSMVRLGDPPPAGAWGAGARIGSTSKGESTRVRSSLIASSSSIADAADAADATDAAAAAATVPGEWI